MAAVLTLGPGAVLSHRSAAGLWGILPGAGTRYHLTVPAGNNGGRRQPGLLIHRRAEVPATTHAGIPVTTVPWTLLDIAATCDDATVDRAVEGAERERLFDLTAIKPLLETSYPGVQALRRAIRAYDGMPTRAELERLFVKLCREHGLPLPLVNSKLGDYEVDFVWHEHRVVVETDGLSTHGTRAAAERDRRRDAAPALAGYRTIRFTWRQVTQESEIVLAVLRTVLV